MKSINKLIIYYVFEIVVVIMFVGISIPIWKSFDKSNMSHIANSYSNMDYLYLDVKRFISDDQLLDEVKIINDTNTLRNYKLIMKVDKNLNIKTINVNNASYNLAKIKYNEDNNYYYYLVDESNLVANNKIYNIKFKGQYNGITYEIIESKNI